MQLCKLQCMATVVILSPLPTLFFLVGANCYFFAFQNCTSFCRRVMTALKSGHESNTTSFWKGFPRFMFITAPYTWVREPERQAMASPALQLHMPRSLLVLPQSYDRQKGNCKSIPNTHRHTPLWLFHPCTGKLVKNLWKPRKTLL